MRRAWIGLAGRRRLKRRGLASCTAVVAAFGVAGTAHAYTYSPCTVTDNARHCYAIADWSPAANEVFGSSADLMTSSASVPNYTNDFVTNEMWTSFSNNPATWIESGAIIGRAGSTADPIGSPDGHTPTAFYASNTAAGFYGFNIGGVTLSDGAWYHVENDNEGGGFWATWFNGVGPFGPNSGVPSAAVRLEDGMEMTNTNTSDNGQSDTTEWRDSTNAWHAGWNDAVSHAIRVTPGYDGENTSPTCVLPTSYPYLGAVAWVSSVITGPPGTCFEGNAGPSAPAAAAAADTVVPAPSRAATGWGSAPAVRGPLLDAAQVRSRALASAASAGEDRPTGVNVEMHQTRYDALKTLGDGAALPSTSGPAGPWLRQDADLVTLRGHFSIGDLPHPPGTSGTVTGTELTLAVDAQTGRPFGIHVR